METIWPLQKDDKYYLGFFTPKQSIRISPFYKNEADARKALNALSPKDRARKISIAKKAVKNKEISK